MLFQNTIDHIDSEISQLLAQVEAAKQRQSQLTELDALTDSTLGQLGDVVGKIGQVAPDAIASLKSAVLGLFESGDNGNDGNDGGNQPIDPTPGPDDDSPELKSLNGLTGDCLTTADIVDEAFPIGDPTGDEWVLPSDAPLTGQTCDFDPDIYWETTPPDGSSYELASHLACQLWEDAPMLEQYCTITSSTTEDNQNKGTTGEGEHMPYIELITHPENEALAYQRKHDGEIVCCYIGFTAKARAQSWQQFALTMTDKVELRPASRMGAFKHELKIKGLSLTQIDRLASSVDTKKTYHKPWNGESKPPSYKEEAPRLPVNPDEVEPGDIVTPLLTPGDSYEVIQVSKNGILDCKSTRTGVQMGMRPTAVTLVQKAPKVEVEETESPVEPELTLEQRIQAAQRLQKESLQRNGTISPTQWKELQVLAKQGGLSQEQLGQIALIPYGYTRGGQILSRQLDEITQKVKNAVARYSNPLETNGNYLGLSQQVKQHWEKAGVDPSDLVAQMRARRPAEPEWDAAKYNPVLVAMGDDAEDF